MPSTLADDQAEPSTVGLADQYTPPSSSTTAQKLVEAQEMLVGVPHKSTAIECQLAAPPCRDDRQCRGEGLRGVSERNVREAHDHVAVPISGPVAVVNIRRSGVDQLAGCDKPDGPLVGAPTTLAQWPARTQPRGEIPAQAALSRGAQGLVDRLLAHVPGRPVWELQPQPATICCGLHSSNSLR